MTLCEDCKKNQVAKYDPCDNCKDRQMYCVHQQYVNASFVLLDINLLFRDAPLSRVVAFCNITDSDYQERYDKFAPFMLDK